MQFDGAELRTQSGMDHIIRFLAQKARHEFCINLFLGWTVRLDLWNRQKKGGHVYLPTDRITLRPGTNF